MAVSDLLNTAVKPADVQASLVSVSMNLRDEFQWWLVDGNARKYSPVALLSSFDNVSDYARKKKISSVNLWELKRRSDFIPIYNKLVGSKLLRIMERNTYKVFIVASQLYLDFIDEHLNIKKKSTSVSAPDNHTSQMLVTDTEDIHFIDLSGSQDLSNVRPRYFEYFGERHDVDKSWQRLYASIVQCLLEDYPDRIYGLRGKGIGNSGRMDVSEYDGLTGINTPKRISDNLYIDIGLSTDKIIVKIRHLLDLCNVDYENLVISYSSQPQNSNISNSIEKKTYRNLVQKVSRNTAGSNSFYSWLIDEQGLSEATSRVYASAINTAERFAQKHQLGAKQLSGTDDFCKIEDTVSSLLQSDAFREHNNYRHNHIRAALKKYLEYANTVPPVVTRSESRSKETHKSMISPNDVVEWVITQPNAKGKLYLKSVAQQYVNAMRSAPAKLDINLSMVERNPFTCQSIKEFDPLWATCKTAPNYRQVNTATSGSFSAGMACLRRYLDYNNATGNQSVQSPPDEGLYSSEVTSLRNDVTDKEIRKKLTVVLSTRFTNGFRIDSPIEMVRLRSFGAEDLGKEITLNDEELKNYIMDCGTIFDGKVYAVSANAKERIKELAEEYFADGAKAIFYTEFYTKNENWLFGKSVVSEEMLIGILRKLFPKLSFTQTYFGYTDVPVFTILEVEILRVWGDDVLLTYAQLAKRLQYIPIDRIKYILAQNGDFIWSSMETFSHVSRIKITNKEREAICDAAIGECNTCGYVPITDLPFSEVGERNDELSVTAVQNAVYRICLSDKFDKKGKIVTRKGDIFDALTIMKEYCRTIDKCSLDDLLNYEKELTGEVHRWIPMEAGNTVLVRINKEIYVADRYVHFNAELIDEAIELVVEGDYLPLKSFTTFGAFPDCGQTWNPFLLESYCRRFSRKFRFDTPSVNSRNAGAVIRKSCGMVYIEIMTDAVANADVPLKDAAVGRFLFDSGYTGRSTNAKVTEIIDKAKAIRERRG